MGKSIDWVVWCRSRGEKTDKKGGKGQSVRWKAWWRQGNIKCAVREDHDQDDDD